MLKKRISKIALIVASIFFLQPYLSVVSTLTVSATTTVEITDVVNAGAMNQEGLSINQTATKLSASQLEVITTLSSEQPIAEVMLKQTINENFKVLRENTIVQSSDGNQVFSQSGAEIPTTLTTEPIIGEEPTSFTIGGSDPNSILYGRALVAGVTYTVTSVYDLAAESETSEVILFTPTTFDYRLYESAVLPATLDLASISPTITISEALPPTDEVIPPVETLPPTENVDPPVEEIPPVEEVIPPVTEEEPLIQEEIPPVQVMPFTAVQELPTVEKLQFSKSATRQGDGYDNYQIELDITGEPTVTPAIPVDIVLVLDKSSSMTQGNPPKIDKLVTAAESFVSTIMGTDMTDAQMAIVDFHGTATIHDFGSGNYWSKNISDVQAAITNQTIYYTNVEAGYKQANVALQTARPEARKYVVLFSDGLPSAYLGNNNQVVFVGEGNATAVSKAQEAYTQILNTYNPAPYMYSIGLYSGSANNTGENFLFSVQNQEVDKATYLSKYYTNDANTLNTIFTTLAEEIKATITPEIALDSVVTDVISPTFILDDVPKVTLTTVTPEASISLTKDDGGTFDLYEYQVTKVPCELDSTIQCDKLVVNIGTLKAPNAKLTFNIERRDPYFGTTTLEEIDAVDSPKVPTNDNNAILDYIDPVDKETTKQITVGSPLVALPFVEGTVTIEKIAPETEQKFSVLLEGFGTYDFPSNSTGNNTQTFGFDLQSGVAQTMSFYMKGEQTDTDPNADYTQNYVTVGQFNIREIIPQNYALASIEYAYDTDLSTAGLQGTYVTYEAPLTINKDNRALYIRLTNTSTNTEYWYDRAEVENVFSFHYTQQPVALSLGKEDQEVA